VTKKRVKVTAQMRGEWAKLRASLSDYAIAEKYGVTEGAIRYHLGNREAAQPVEEPAPVPAAVPLPVALPSPEPRDESPMDREAIAGVLAGLMREQSDLAGSLKVSGDLSGARSAVRAVTALGSLLQKMQAKDDDDSGSVRVKLADMRAAADKGRAKLADYLERVRLGKS
jgi:hypothetical protein